jgi:hypothetical protein
LENLTSSKTQNNRNYKGINFFSKDDFAKKYINLKSKVLICNDVDFHTALELVKILIQHAAQVYQQLPAEAAVTSQPNQKQHWQYLPKPVFRAVYLKKSCKLIFISGKNR